MASKGFFNAFQDIWILDGVRTPMVDYCGALGHISPTDLGIKAARAALARAAVAEAQANAAEAAANAQRARELQPSGALSAQQVAQLVVHNVRAAVLIVHQVAAELLVHLERMQVNLQSVSRSHVRRCAKNSTICKHHNWVEQLFLTVMEIQRFVCAAVLPSQTLQRRLVQIQQR